MTLRQKLRWRDDVAEALRHLLRAHVDEAVVHPKARERCSGVSAAALSDLVLVVREDEVEPAAMDIDGLAKMLLDHRRALDVPTGAPPGPRRIPADHAFFTRLPQHKVRGIALVRRDLDAGAGDHLLTITTGEHAIIGVARHREKDMAFGFIGMTEAHQSLDQ